MGPKKILSVDCGLVISTPSTIIPIFPRFLFSIFPSDVELDSWNFLKIFLGEITRSSWRSSVKVWLPGFKFSVKRTKSFVATRILVAKSFILLISITFTVYFSPEIKPDNWFVAVYITWSPSINFTGSENTIVE